MLDFVEPVKGVATLEAVEELAVRSIKQKWYYPGVVGFCCTD